VTRLVGIGCHTVTLGPYEKARTSRGRASMSGVTGDRADTADPRRKG
jgi:hypothetical protein